MFDMSAMGNTPEADDSEPICHPIGYSPFLGYENYEAQRSPRLLPTTIGRPENLSPFQTKYYSCSEEIVGMRCVHPVLNHCICVGD